MIKKIFIGLGNPGKEYEKTRHNAGFLAIDFLIKKYKLKLNFNKKFNAEIAEDNEGLGVLFVKPQTFMNNSGKTVYSVLSYYKLISKNFGLKIKKDIDLSEVLTVIHDDVDIDFGKYKVSVNSRSAGHNGVQSVIDNLKTKNFKRIRIGIKNEVFDKVPREKFVLQRFSGEEFKIIEKLIKDIF